MTKVQSVDRKASFLFVANVKANHEEWLVFSTTTVHSRAALDFVSPLGYDQMVTEPTHIDGGVLDFVLISVHDLVEVRVGSPVGISDQSGIFIDVVLEHLVCRQEAYLKNSVDWELARIDVDMKAKLEWDH